MNIIMDRSDLGTKKLAILLFCTARFPFFTTFYVFTNLFVYAL